MAFNAFTSVRITDDGETLFVNGFTGSDIDGVTAMQVVLHAPGNSDVRLEAPVEDLGEKWHAEIPNGAEGDRPFALGDDVQVVGVAIHGLSSRPSPFAWGGQFVVKSWSTSLTPASGRSPLLATA